jgi:DNA-binding MarR family transcriptional regulator
VKIEDEIRQPKFKSHFQKVVVNLIYTANWLQAKQQEFFKSYGITSPQYNILRILRGQQPNAISGAEIKERMLDRNSDVSRLLARLIRKELVSKSPCSSDKRAADVVISASGLELLEQIDKEIEESERTNIHLSKAEAAQLSILLDRLRG